MTVISQQRFETAMAKKTSKKKKGQSSTLPSTAAQGLQNGASERCRERRRFTGIARNHSCLVCQAKPAIGWSIITAGACAGTAVSAESTRTTR